MTDPGTAPEELLPQGPAHPERALGLLRRRGFRRAYAAVAISELGDAFQYIALMWFALVAAGPLGVIAVRLADSIPALLFGLHGGVAADRWDRRRLMISADLVRGVVLVPIAVAGLTGHLPLAALVVAAFVLTTATSYFEPAYGALLPALVDRRNVQQANGLVRATADALSVGGWALAGLLLTVLPISVFFAINAASFFLSAALLTGVRARGTAERGDERPRIRDGFAALRPRPTLAASVVVLGVAVTLSSGTWIVGVPELVRSTLGARSGQLLSRRGFLRARLDLCGRGACPLAGSAESAREHACVDALPAGVCTLCVRGLALGRACSRVGGRSRTGLVVGADQLGRPGGGARRAAGARNRARVARPPRSARNRTALRRAALRAHRARA